MFYLKEAPKYLGPQYRKTFYETEIERRNKIARKKEEKQRSRAEEKQIAVWNVDNQVMDGSLEIDVR